MAGINSRGYEQVDVEHHDVSSIAYPLTKEITIRIVMIILLMKNWYGELIGVKGEFLMVQFYNDEMIYLEVPEEF